MKQNSEFKKIINDMIREYQDEPSPVASRLYTILAQHLEEESSEEIQDRLDSIKKVSQ